MLDPAASSAFRHLLKKSLPACIHPVSSLSGNAHPVAVGKNPISTWFGANAFSLFDNGNPEQLLQTLLVDSHPAL